MTDPGLLLSVVLCLLLGSRLDAARFRGKRQPCRRGGHVSESWLFSLGSAGMWRLRVSQRCRRVGIEGRRRRWGVERGERGGRRGISVTIPSLPGVRPTACRERRARYALEGRPLVPGPYHDGLDMQAEQ